MPDWIANLCNGINDWDLAWVGFRALRPARDQPMTAGVVARLCVVYCPLAAAAAFLIAWVLLHEVAPARVPWIIAAAAAVAFLLLQSLLAYCWNRRVATLRQKRPR